MGHRFERTFLLALAASALAARSGAAVAPDLFAPGTVSAVQQLVDKARLLKPERAPAAPLPALPLLVDSGGPVITHGRIVPIFFRTNPDQEDDMRAQILDFYRKLSRSDYWKDVTGAYRVGAIGVGEPIIIDLKEVTSDPATVTDQQLAQWLIGRSGGTHPEWPAPSVDTVYTLTPPKDVHVMLGTQDVCAGALGYHDWLKLNSGAAAPFVVVPRCLEGIAGISPRYKGLVPEGFDTITAVLSHELVEAGTDPLTDLQPAFMHVDADAVAYEYAFSFGAAAHYAEIGDLCEGFPYTFLKIGGLGVVARMWSNEEAAEHQDPCVPKREDLPYFNSLVEAPDVVQVPRGPGDMVQAHVIRVPNAAGASVTVPVRLFGDAAAGAWKVTAYSPDKSLSFSFNGAASGSGSAGQTLALTVARAAAQMDSSPRLVGIISGGDIKLQYFSWVLVSP